MAFKISKKSIFLISIVLIAGLVIVGIILAIAFKDFISLSPIEKAKENALRKVLRDQRGNPMISEDKFRFHLLLRNPKYQITYQESNDTFLISVNASPFEEVRQEAEKAFLSLIDSSEEIACQLKVKITTPAFANPELAGQRFPLSFCK